MKAPIVTQAADNTYLVGGTHVNWIVLTEGDAVTLIDGGYPGDLGAVEESLRGLGYRLEQITAVLVTHAHVDHVGSLPELVRRSKAPVYLSEREARHARGDYVESATIKDVAVRLWRPGFLGWTLDIMKAGATEHEHLSEAKPFPGEGALDLPGRPVPVATPGHTSGHSCYHLPGVGAMVTGDTLVTAHPTARRPGPQLLMPFFSHDQAATVRALDTLQEFDADIILPGHGPVYRGPLRDACAVARDRA